MVMNYQGAFTIKKKDETPTSVTVSDYMATRLVKFYEHQTVNEVMEQLLKHKISGGPVLNEKEELVGVISEGDCLKEVVRGKYNNSPGLPALVSDYMATNVLHITPETNIFEAANMFLRLRFRRFPVMKDGKLVGQISQRDVMKAVMKMRTENWKH